MSTPQNTDFPRTLRLASIELGFRERGELMTLEIQKKTIEALEERGIEWEPNSIRPSPRKTRNSQPPKIQTRRKNIRDVQYDQFIESNGPMVCTYEPGIGKTTTYGREAGRRDRFQALSFSTHEKAREFLREDFINEDYYFHLKGMKQPLYHCCSDDNKCKKHGEDSPLMCPMYEASTDEALFRRFKALENIAGHRYAHETLPTSDRCEWSLQFENLNEKQRIVCVHEYQQYLDSDRDIIIDESPRVGGDTESASLGDLGRAATLLRHISYPNAELVAGWIENELEKAVQQSDLSICAKPAINTNGDVAERLAELKIEYNEAIAMQIDLEEWNGGAEPCFDVILAAMAETGFEPTACKEAMEGPKNLFTCPRCNGDVEDNEGEVWCLEKKCGWNSRFYGILAPRGRRRQARAEGFTEDDDLRYISIPDPSDLPDDPLILDATATLSKIAAIYGVTTDEISVTGDEPIELNAHVTQIKNGQYHAHSIKKSIERDGKLARRIQRSIDRAARDHQKPLFVIKERLEHYFDFPDHGEVANYGSLRGLDSMNDCDAVMCIGAFHPPIDALRREARLLAADHPDIEVGGVECSNRDDSPHPPVERELNCAEGMDTGWTVRTKAFTGLVGDLFEEVREKEIIQAVHRIRPHLSDEEKHIYILSNVPTELPIDEFISWEEFIDPPVPENAMKDLVTPLVERSNKDKIEISNSDAIEIVGDSRTPQSVRGWMRKLSDAGIAEHVGNTSTGSKNYSVDIQKLRSIAYPNRRRG